MKGTRMFMSSTDERDRVWPASATHVLQLSRTKATLLITSEGAIVVRDSEILRSSTAYCPRSPIFMASPRVQLHMTHAQPVPCLRGRIGNDG